MARVIWTGVLEKYVIYFAVQSNVLIVQGEFATYSCADHLVNLTDYLIKLCRCSIPFTVCGRDQKITAAITQIARFLFGRPLRNMR